MNTIIKKYTDVNLVLRIVIGLLIGVCFALLVPQAKFIAIFGTLFVGALKGIAPILVFILVSSSLTNAKLGHKSNMSHVILLYAVGTFAASLLAVVASFLFPVKMAFSGTADLSGYTPPSSIADVINTLLANLVSNPVASIANGNYLGILFWAIILGLSLRKLASSGFKKALENTADAAAMAVRWIIQFAPFGIMGLIYSAVSESGLAIFTEYGKLLLVLVSCMLIMFLVVNPLIVFLDTHKNPYPLVFRCIKESAFTAFFTRSSAANIPVNMELCESLGLDKDNYSISIPLGATINMEGAAITIAVMTLSAVQTLGIPVSFFSALLLCILAAVGACGASGVAGGSLLLIPMACSLFGIGADLAMGVVAVGFIIGVVQDSFETALNSSTDALFTASAEFRNRRLAAAKAAREGKAEDAAQQEPIA